MMSADSTLLETSHMMMDGNLPDKVPIPAPRYESRQLTTNPVYFVSLRSRVSGKRPRTAQPTEPVSTYCSALTRAASSGACIL